MNTASSLFVLVLLGSLVADAVAQTGPRNPRAPQAPAQSLPAPLPSYSEPVPQPGHHQPGHVQIGHVQPGQGQLGLGQIITQRTLQSIRSYDRLRLTDLLRLSQRESRDLEVLSVSVLAQGIRAQTFLELKSLGRIIAPAQQVRRQLSEVRFVLPSFTMLDELELSASDEAILDTLTVEVRERRGGGGGYEQQPASGELLRLRVHQSVRGFGEIPLRQLVKQQLGLTLEGAQIERVVVQGQLLGRGSASVQVHMNNRLVGPIKHITYDSRQTPIPLNSYESVQGPLKLIVRGEVVITEISIRVGQVHRIR